MLTEDIRGRSQYPRAVADDRQVVAVEWTETPAGGLPFRAVRVRLREDLQATPGG